MSERKALIIIVLIAAVLAALLELMALARDARTARHEEAVARCKSLGGEYASSKCFINGEEQ